MEDKTLIEVAYYVQLGYSNKNIAKTISISESLVSRAIKTLYDRKWIHQKVSLEIPPNCKRYLPMFDDKLEHQLKSTFTMLKKCRVIKTKKRQHNLTEKAIINEASRRVFEIAGTRRNHEATHNFIVSYGRTVRDTINNIPELTDKEISEDEQASTSPRNIEVFASNGDFALNPDEFKDSPIDFEKSLIENNIKCSANTNSTLLSKKLRNRIYHLPITLPALLDCTDTELRNCASIFDVNYSLKKLFGSDYYNEIIYDKDYNKDAICYNAHTLFTSIGVPGRLPEHAFSVKGGLKSSGKKTPPNGLTNLAGDIAGAIFDKNGGKLKFPNRQFIGMRLNHIKQIAAQHHSRFIESETKKQRGIDAPVLGGGVIVVAHGVDRAVPLRILLENNFINEIITESDVAKKVLKL